MKLLAGTAACLALPGAAGAIADPSGMLGADIAAVALPFPGARLDLVRVVLSHGQGPARISAVVRMTWAPGFRQYPFVAEAADMTSARAALVAAVAEKFRAAR
jgi:hypothetical protein